MRPALLVALLVTMSVSVAGEHERRIALTFDDAPRSDGPFLTGAERTDKLIAAMADVGAEGSMFFVTTENLDARGDSGVERLQKYVDAGHVLANHSHDHMWLWKNDVDTYVADIDLASNKLAAFDNVAPYFRFPFLDEGRELEKRDAVRAALAERELSNGYVTVDNYDWYMVSLAGEARKAGHEIDMDALRDAYVELLVDAVEFYDAMAVETLGRSPAHTLLLHENDLAALFVDDLVRALQARGWTIIPALEAYEDPISQYEPDTLFLGQGRIAAMAHEGGQARADLVHLTEDEAMLREEFQKRGLLPQEN